MVDEELRSAPVLYLEDVARRRAGEIVALARDELRHLRALRLSPGDGLRLTDARGVLWAARLGDGGAEARLIERLDPPPPLEVELWAAVGNKQATLWLVEKAAEFGLRRLHPVETVRSASVADAGRSAGFWDKARRRALAAVKQSGSAWAPEITPSGSLEDRLGSDEAGGIRVVLDPGGPPLATVLEAWTDGAERPTLLVGPEGGLEESERWACESAGFRPASLGPTVLRFETAAVAALAVAAQRALVLDADDSIEGSEV